MKSAIALVTVPGSSQVMKWPAVGEVTSRRSSTRSARPSSWTGRRAASFSPQMTRVGMPSFGKGAWVQSGAFAASPGAGTSTFYARYQLSIVVSTPGCDQSSR